MRTACELAELGNVLVLDVGKTICWEAEFPLLLIPWELTPGAKELPQADELEDAGCGKMVGGWCPDDAEGAKFDPVQDEEVMLGCSGTLTITPGRADGTVMPPTLFSLSTGAGIEQFGSCRGTPGNRVKSCLRKEKAHMSVWTDRKTKCLYSQGGGRYP